MELKQVEFLLEKFYDGDTTEEQERGLKDFFMTADVPEWLESDRDYFLVLDGKRSESAPNFDMAAELDAVIDREKSKKPRGVKRKMIRYFGAVAALIVMALFVPRLVSDNQKSISAELKSRDTYTDPKIAYAEAKKALMVLSEVLNSGAEPLSNLKSFEKGLSQVRKVSKFDEVVSGTTRVN